MPRVIELFLVCGASIAEEAAMVPSSEIVRIMQFESLKPVFEYCQTAVPEMETEILSEFESFYARFDGAMKRFLERLPPSELGSVPAVELEELRRHIAEAGRAKVEVVKQYDPRMYCPRFLINVRSATMESLQRTIEDAYARHQDRVKAKQQASQQ